MINHLFAASLHICRPFATCDPGKLLNSMKADLNELLHTLNSSFSFSDAMLSSKNAFHLLLKLIRLYLLKSVLLGFEDGNLVMATYTPRRSFRYAAFSASVGISFKYCS